MKLHSKNEISRLKSNLKRVLVNPKARLIENKYKAIRQTLVELHPHFAKQLSPEQLLTIVEDSISLDRYWRLETQEEQKEEKKILSEQWQLDNL